MILEFSEPVANAHDVKNYEFYWGRNAGNIYDEDAVFPSSATVAGAEVTLTLPESRTGLIAENMAHNRSQSWPTVCRICLMCHLFSGQKNCRYCGSRGSSLRVSQ